MAVEARRVLWAALTMAAVAAACTALPPRNESVAAETVIVVEEEGGLAWVSPDGQRRHQLVPAEAGAAGSRRLSWPTRSPDGRRVAYFRSEAAAGRAEAALDIVESDGQLRTIWRSERQRPIYLAWAPTGDRIGLLVQDFSTLALLLVEAKGGPAQPVGRGQPLYFTWAPDGQRVLLHIGGDGSLAGGGQLLLVDLRRGVGETLPIASTPGRFRAPAWSPSGRFVAYASGEPGEDDAIVLLDPDRGTSTPLVRAGADPAFIWAPRQDILAYSGRRAPGVLPYDGLATVGLDGHPPRPITSAPVLAFFWSPDGSMLAYVALDEGRNRLTWWVAPADGSATRQLVAFRPTSEGLQLLNFFDQYAQSVSPWAPDGSALVTAVRREEGENGSSPSTSRVLLVPSTGATPQPLGPGLLAFWAPAPRAGD